MDAFVVKIGKSCYELLESILFEKGEARLIDKIGMLALMLVCLWSIISLLVIFLI